MGVTEFLKRLQTVTVGALVNQVCILFVVIFFSLLSRDLLLWVGQTAEVKNGYGFQLAGLVIGAVLGKVITNAVANHKVRTTSREFLEGSAKAETAKAEAAKAETAAALATTQEHAAATALLAGQALSGPPSAPLAADPDSGPQWAAHTAADPQEGDL